MSHDYIITIIGVIIISSILTCCVGGATATLFLG